jgi:hypothetical protein
MTLVQTVSAIGLLLQFFGAMVSASGVLLNDDTATQLASPMWDLHQPLKDALLKQSRRTVIGLGILSIGSVLQFIAIFLPTF